LSYFFFFRPYGLNVCSPALKLGKKIIARGYGNMMILIKKRSVLEAKPLLLRYRKPGQLSRFVLLIADKDFSPLG
jgi:hypothetical protein